MSTEAAHLTYKGRWEDGTPGWRRYRKVKGAGRANQPEGEQYPVLTFTCIWCADRKLHTRPEHDTIVNNHPGRYIREASEPFQPKRRPRTPPDPKRR